MAGVVKSITTAKGLVTNATGGLVALADLANSSGSGVLLGRGAGSGAGTYQEITLGANLSMTGTTLDAAGGSSYTDEQAQDAVGAMVADTATIDATYTDATPELKFDVKANSLTAGYLHASATDVLFGRSTSGAGAGEEVACTAAGRALLDDADAAAQRTTLGLGTAATQSSGAFAAASHTHAASDVTSGTVATARLGSGTANNTTFLRGDQTWATPSSTLDVTGLTATDVAFADELPEYDASATANRKVTVSRLGGFLLGPYAGGRLTLTTGVPVDNNDVTNATTVYYAPYASARATVYDGTRWGEYSFSQLSIKLTDAQTCTTTSGSANLTVADSSQLIRGMEVSGTGISGGTTVSSITSATVVVLSANATTSATNTITFKVPASKNVDLFLVDSSGSLQLRGTIWTGDTTRAVALGDQDGYDCVNNAVIASGDSNSIAAKCGLYVGVVRTTNAGQTEDSYGGASQSGGKRFVWNRYNRELRHLAVTDTTDNWVYTTDSFHQANGAAGNKVEFVFGCRTQLMQAVAVGLAANNTPCYVSLGVGEDSVTVNSAKLVSGLVAGGNPAGIPAALYQGQPAGAGYHYLAWLERSQATGTTAFYGDNAGTVGIQSGLQAWGLF